MDHMSTQILSRQKKEINGQFFFFIFREEAHKESYNKMNESKQKDILCTYLKDFLCHFISIFPYFIKNKTNK